MVTCVIVSMCLVQLDTGPKQGRREGWARGGRCPPELPKFLLIITVHCIEMYYLPPLHKRQKKLSYLLLHVSELNNLN